MYEVVSLNSLLYNLRNDFLWDSFLNDFITNNPYKKQDILFYTDYIINRNYKSIVEKILSGEYSFSPPVRISINKIESGKKRTVYSITPEETIILKMINRLLQSRTELVSDVCHSFLKSKSAKTAFDSILCDRELNKKFCYRMDISDYFNSIDTGIMLRILKQSFCDDYITYRFFEGLLLNNEIIDGNSICTVYNKGVMAGTPTAPFLSNLYLKEIDEYFKKFNVTYARYSDDIIFFSEQDSFYAHIDYMHRKLDEYKLSINTKKTEVILPGLPWNFLGFKYSNGKIDLSDITVKKLKGKISRASRKIYRWKLSKGASDEKAIRIMINKFNKKLYSSYSDNDFNWTKWFFPMINCTDSLKLIDIYMQQHIRYLTTGKHNKTRYKKVSYSMLKEYGYRPLVKEYYQLVCKNS